jgi:hypothetical protein
LASEILKKKSNQMTKQSGPIVIREQLPRSISSVKDDSIDRSDIMEYDTINSKSIKGYKF